MKNKLIEILWSRYQKFTSLPALVFGDRKITYQTLINDICRGILYLEQHNIINKKIAYFTDFADYDQIISVLCTSIVSQKNANYFWTKPLGQLLKDIKTEDSWDAIIVPHSKWNDVKDYQDLVPNNFWMNLTKKFSHEEIHEIFNKYDDNNCVVGVSSSGSSKPNTHWTYHTIDEIINATKPFKQLLYNGQRIMRCAYIALSDPFQLLSVWFSPWVKVSTLWCFAINDKVLWQNGFFENFIKENRINYMLTITSNLFEANRFMSEIEIIHLRSINDKNDEYIKQLINNGCKYINLLASSEYLIQMISVVEKNNLANFGWFNVFGSDYQIDKTTGELSWLYKNHFYKTGDIFEEYNKKIRWLGRTNGIQFGMKLKEKQYDAK